MGRGFSKREGREKRMFRSTWIGLFLIFSLLPSVALLSARQEPGIMLEKSAQEKSAPGENTNALRKAAQSPAARLFSVPFQNNTSYRIGPNNLAHNLLNFQPGSWIFGVLLNDIWSAAGTENYANLKQMFRQYFVNHNPKREPRNQLCNSSTGSH
jgi:hypothetical protein